MNVADIIAEAAGLGANLSTGQSAGVVGWTPWLWVLLSLACTCGGQVAQKLAVQAMKRTPKDKGALIRFADPWLLAAAFLLGMGALFWLLVLQAFPVGVAYPLLATNFAIMAIIARYGFKETISQRRWLGVLCIILGVAILGASA